VEESKTVVHLISSNVKTTWHHWNCVYFCGF